MADPRNVPNTLLQRAATYLIVPTILFILLSPGLLLEIPARHHFIGLTTHHTSWQAILVHAVVFLILNYLIFLAFLSADRRPGDENRPAFHDLSESTMIKALKYSIIPTIVFIILSPGLLLTIPGAHNRWIEFTSFHTSVAAVFVHAAVFYALNYAIFTWLMARESARAETEPLLRPRA
eukprot:TRINITY_DN17367_c0_g1_i1.p1 TRINITY_DN17367_c0_g1~~TRINITY_DN17367_c0_g1_i1.p1  ORF type:complete len:179 (-),score=52.72 TRINITY_DN17367_c0_g1_i1:560-1096(-)